MLPSQPRCFRFSLTLKMEIQLAEELGIDARVVGQEAFVSFILIALIFWRA